MWTWSAVVLPIFTMASVMAAVISRRCWSVRPANHWIVMFGTVSPRFPPARKAGLREGYQPQGTSVTASSTPAGGPDTPNQSSNLLPNLVEREHPVPLSRAARHLHAG